MSSKFGENCPEMPVIQNPRAGGTEVGRDGRHDDVGSLMVLLVRAETTRHLEVVRRAKMQTEFPVFFKYPHRQDGETQLCQQQDETSRPRGRPVEHAAGLVAAFRGQAEDGLRVLPGKGQGCPHRAGARCHIFSRGGMGGMVVKP